MSRQLWPHQERGISEVQARIMCDEQRICLTSPTGGGKSLMIEELIRWGVAQHWDVALYTHRQLLRDQISETLKRSEISHGLIASGFEKDHRWKVQICMIQTVASAIRHGHDIPKAKLVIVDECHDQARGVCQSILEKHIANGAHVVGVTATPLDIGHLYESLVVAGVNSELRECGAHVWCDCYEPTVPDMASELKRIKTGEFQYGDVVKAVMTPVIFGHVLTHWKRLNPDARPTILFAPGVKESIWFMDQFKRNGIRAAHICGESVIVDGEEMKGDRLARQQVLSELATGGIKVICNRFVLREGWDCREIFHGILATCMGSPVSYLQSVGRILRSHPSLDKVVLQDHGGNVYRHGSPNMDREWDMTKTPTQVCAEQKERQQSDSEHQPIVCPECGFIRESGPQCPSCLFKHTKSIRRVIQLDGQLVKIPEGASKKREPKVMTDIQAWEQLYHIGKHKGWTFKRAAGIFKSNQGHWPPKNIRLSPKRWSDWSSVIGDLSYRDLN